MEPLLREVRLGRSGRETQAALRVVALDEVLEDGAGLPEGDVGVGVVDGGDAAVGVDGEVFGLLDVREGNGVYVVGKAEFLEHDEDFGRVGATFTPERDGLEL